MGSGMIADPSWQGTWYVTENCYYKNRKLVLTIAVKQIHKTLKQTTEQIA